MMLRSAASPGSWGWSTGSQFTWFLVPRLRIGRPLIKSAAPLRAAALFLCVSSESRDTRREKPAFAKRERARPLWRAPCLITGNQDLLDLGFLEFDVLLRDRIVLGLGHLIRHRAAVLRGDVEEAGVSRREQLDLDGRCFRHGRSAFS